MITRAEVEKLGIVHAVDPVVLSLYLAVPLDPAQLRGLPARASELMARSCPAEKLSDTDREEILAKVAALGRDWLGHGAAIFRCADIGLFEMYRLPGTPPERALLGARPHIRPLLAAVQQHPAYRVAVVDRKHAWVFAVSGDEIATVADSATVTMPSHRSDGWYGLKAHRVHERVIQQTRHHYTAAAAILADLARHGEPEPLVIGGHHDGIGQLLASLPPRARDVFAGSFAVDTHALTPARIRELSEPVVTRWAQQRAQRLADEIAQLPPDQAAIGLDACVTAVNDDAAEVLVVPEDGLIAGYVCGRCGALGTAPDHCPDWGTAAQPVPDLIEEMVTRTLRQGGQICILPDVSGRLAAKLRFPR